jgi:glycosyltransferase involved in cell wall biosynthesis
MVKASIIIPAYQEEDYIENTLKSAFHPETEIIVVTNGCTDKTAKIAMRYADKILELENKGVSKARNEGAKIASGSKLIFLDADIKLQNNTIEKILNSKYSIGTCYSKPDVNKFVPKTLMQLKKPFQHLGWSSGLIFCSKEVYNKMNGFDENMDFGEDGKFIRKAKKIGKFGVVNTHVINSMRRFEKEGYTYWIMFWIKNIFNKQKNGYEAIR